MAQEGKKVKVGDKTLDIQDVLEPWLNRKDEAEKALKEYLSQIRINRKFAEGKQHLDFNPRDGRVVDVRTRNIGGVATKMVTNNVLDQYLLTAIGRMTGNDYRPNFLAGPSDESTDQITQMLNDAFGWGWENEWAGDSKVLQLLRLLVIDGTAAIRIKYDKSVGEMIGDFPLKDGRVITSEKDARKFVAEAQAVGQKVAFAQVRDGKVCWEVLSVDQFLTPAGMEYPENFPWIIIRRPVSVAEIKRRYAEMAEGVNEENIEATSPIGGKEGAKLSNRAMLYTGYQMPSAGKPNGATIVFTQNNLLDYFDFLPLSDHPKGPRCGVHFFRWQVIPGRFHGKAFIENGIGAQTVRNKRATQIDAIIDRGMPKIAIEEQSMARPKTGEPLEVLELHPGSPLPQLFPGVQPGGWMLDDIKMQDDNIERAMGMRSISLGQPPQGVSAYSAMALLSENDSLKLDPIAQELRLGMIEVAWDTMECMRHWPRAKNMEIAGPDGSLRAFVFSANMIPLRYIVHAPRQGALPRSQASELQKINDIWNAAASVGSPLPLEWYTQSLNAGKAQDLPASMANVSRHKAELENIVMFHTKQTVPVSPEDDDQGHVEVHRNFLQQLQAQILEGDTSATEVATALEQHRQAHLQSASQKPNAQGAAPPGGLETAPGGTGETPGSIGPTPGSLGAGTSPSGRLEQAGATPTPDWMFRPRPRSGL